MILSDLPQVTALSANRHDLDFKLSHMTRHPHTVVVKIGCMDVDVTNMIREALRAGLQEQLDATNDSLLELGVVLCETCRDEGWIDQSVGGAPLTRWCECPDCHNEAKMPCPAE